MADAFSNVDHDALDLTRAIALSETGQNGRPNYNASGKSGEHGAYQWMPGNFENAAKEAGLNPSDFSPENQDKVAYYQVKKFKDKGYQPWQIASLWNSGSPDNWKDHSGVNKLGVPFDTPAYVAGVKKNYLSLKSGMTTQPAQDQPISDLGNKLAGRVQDIADTFNQPNLARGVLRSAGAVAGGVGDVIGSAVGAVTPDFIKKPVGEAVGGVLAPVVAPLEEKFRQLNPETQKDLGALGNIATLLPIGKGIGLGAKVAEEAIPTALKGVAETGGLVGGAAKKQLVKDALEVVAPKQTAKVAKSGIKAGRGVKSGPLGEISIAPDSRTIRAAEASAGIVRKGKTMTENANLLRSAISDSAQKLEKDLSGMEVVPIVQKEDMNGLIEKAMQEIGDNPTMVGDAAKSAELILKKFKGFLPTGDVTAIDLLKARKKLDAWMESLQTGNVFNPNYETAKTVALRAIRQGANDLIAEKAPNVAVKDSLAHQSALFDALENVSAKAVKEEGTNVLERLAKKHPGIAGLIRGGLTTVGTGLGVGSILNAENH